MLRLRVTDFFLICRWSANHKYCVTNSYYNTVLKQNGTMTIYRILFTSYDVGWFKQRIYNLKLQIMCWKYASNNNLFNLIIVTYSTILCNIHSNIWSYRLYTISVLVVDTSYDKIIVAISWNAALWLSIFIN